MDLNPTYTAVGTLFDNKPMFHIPKYQRAYAWDTGSVEDFIKDLKECFVNRKSNSPISHFFGGVLSVKYSVQGVVRQHEAVDLRGFISVADKGDSNEILLDATRNRSPQRSTYKYCIKGV